jgi:hypothetical protein
MWGCDLYCQSTDVSGHLAERFGTTDNALAVGESEVRTYAWTALLLTALVTVCVPVVAAVSGLPVPALVVAAGLCYLAIVFASRHALAGLASAAIVLTLFDIAATLVDGPGIATVDVVAADVVAVPLLFVLLYELLDDRPSVGFNGRSITSFGLAGFVVWAFVAGLVANGGSSPAGVMYAIEQLRNLVVFVVAALIVRRTDIRCVVYPFLIAVAGNLLVSLAQIVNGGMLGFPFLGEPPDRYLGSFALGSFEIATGFYAGGFVGHGRELVMVLLLALPLAIAVAVRRAWLSPFVAVAAVASVLSIRVADTDAGWATLILLGVGFGACFTVWSLFVAKRRYSTGVTVFTGAVAVVVWGVIARILWFVLQSGDGDTPIFRTGTLAVRIEEYVTAIQVAFKYPLFGIGGKNFYLLSERYGLPADIGVHNTVLSNLAATGFVGGGLYLLAALAAAFVTFRQIVSTDGTERLLWIAMLCSMAAFHAYSSWMAAYHWTVGNAAFWLLAGATIGAASRRYRGRVTNAGVEEEELATTGRIQG